MNLTTAPKQDVALPPLREDLQLIPGASTSDGSPTWVIVDPVRGKYFQIGWAAHQILSRWAAQYLGGHPRSDPPGHRGIVCDVADESQIRSAVARIVDDYKRIDVLINVAGVNRRMAAEKLTSDDYDFVMNTNLRGAFLMSQAVGKQMLIQGSGNQVNITSLNNHTPLHWVLPYAASKAALGQMTRVGDGMGPRGIRVNAIAPGFILSDLTKGLWADETMQAWGRENTPLVRLGSPDDLVGTAIFLASEASAFMTGQILYVDGGITSGMKWPIEHAMRDQS